MNVFLNESVASVYDSYYETDAGKIVDKIEKDTITNIISDIPRFPMLELGCGTGQWTECFINSGFVVTAVDSSEYMINIAKEKNLENVKFDVGNVLDLSFPDNSFSVIASITMLEFTGDKKKAFQEMYRVLKPRGWLILGCLNANSELGKIKNDDEILKHAEFLTINELKMHLSNFGEPIIEQCVFYSPSFEILDGKLDQDSDEGAFLAACVRKIK